MILRRDPARAKSAFRVRPTSVSQRLAEARVARGWRSCDVFPVHYTFLNNLALREGADVGTDARNGLNRRTARAKQEALGVIGWRCVS